MDGVGSNKMQSENAEPPSKASFLGTWRKNTVLVLTALAIVAGFAYLARSTLLLNVARVAINHDAEVIGQEHTDTLAIVFPRPPPAWISPMKNRMNEIWDPIKADGVNYFMFAGPRTWLRTFSERSNPRSPYYQSWVGGYVIKRRDGSVPNDLQSWAWQVTTLDQRSWLLTMGDPRPLAESGSATNVGNITIDGHSLPLWHGVMRSHSDLSDHPTSPLATLIGMPPKTSWPRGVDSFHDVILEGYFVCWPEPQHRVSVVIYAVSASYAGPPPTAQHDNSKLVNDELLSVMKSAKLESMN
jgi:hypothetical protein